VTDPGLDLFWTFTHTESLYLSIMKIVFIGSSAYILYLMNGDYKPTQDPKIDTFKVQYLIGGSALLAVIFPYFYTASEVRQIFRKQPDISKSLLMR